MKGEVLIIDRSLWVRHSFGWGAFTNERRCALGHFIVSRGGTPHLIHDRDEWRRTEMHLFADLPTALGGEKNAAAWSGNVIEINNRRDIPNRKRERLLKAEFRRAGIELRFVGRLRSDQRATEL